MTKKDIEKLLDTTDTIGDALYSVSKAITACSAPGQDETGGYVASLTESVMGVTAGLCKIAEAMEHVASAIEDQELQRERRKERERTKKKKRKKEKREKRERQEKWEREQEAIRSEYEEYEQFQIRQSRVQSLTLEQLENNDISIYAETGNEADLIPLKS